VEVEFETEKENGGMNLLKGLNEELLKGEMEKKMD
jgi:hypothetical protein